MYQATRVQDIGQQSEKMTLKRNEGFEIKGSGWSLDRILRRVRKLVNSAKKKWLPENINGQWNSGRRQLSEFD